MPPFMLHRDRTLVLLPSKEEKPRVKTQCLPPCTLLDIAGHPYPQLRRLAEVYFFTDNLETGLYARLQTNAVIPEGALAALDASSQNA